MSGRNTRIIIGAVIVVGLIGVAALAFLWLSGGDGTPSTATVSDSLPITLTARAAVANTEPTIAPTETAPTTVAQAAGEATEAADEIEATQEDAETAEAAVEATQEAEATEAVVTSEALPAAAAEATAEATEAAASMPAAGIFNVVPEESEVSFQLTENLRGQFTVVRGVTKEVAGQIFVDFADPAASQVGVIRINARTLTTDNEFRNRAIRGQILLSSQDEFEFIEFTPTGIEGMPAQVNIGEAVTFQIVGNLLVKGITQPVTFDATVTPVSEDRLEGTVTAVVQRAMYELAIPNVPGVADVSEDVTLTLNFVATREA